jgi:hypothetical protein
MEAASGSVMPTKLCVLNSGNPSQSLSSPVAERTSAYRDFGWEPHSRNVPRNSQISSRYACAASSSLRPSRSLPA